MWNVNMSSWLEVEMCESITLLRKRLEEFNDMDPDTFNNVDAEEIKNIYKALYYIHCLKKEMITKQ
jgi:hypothetical protein